MNKNNSEQEAYDELCCYTLTRGDTLFIHQHAVDAFAAQCADERTKPITLTFALIGLYLQLEKNFSGREVQLAHMRLAKHKKRWPTFNQPQHRGNFTIHDVISAPEGYERDQAIRRWCASVWKAYHESHQKVKDLVKIELWNEE